MSDIAAVLSSGPRWAELASCLRPGVVLVVGRPGLGKTHLVRYLVERLGGGRAAALVIADMGQASVGVPGCLALSLAPPWREADALWFVGDTMPVGNLLQTVVGTAKLTQRARRAGAEWVFIDTSGLVDGPVGRVLKYHKALATGATQVAALQAAGELEPLLDMLHGVVPAIHRIAPVPEARDRTPTERRHFRDARFQAALRGGRSIPFPESHFVGTEWTVGLLAGGDRAALPGTLLGLLDGEGYCLGIGLLEEHRPGSWDVFTAYPDPVRVVRIQTGKLRLSPTGEELLATRAAAPLSRGEGH